MNILNKIIPFVIGGFVILSITIPLIDDVKGYLVENELRKESRINNAISYGRSYAFDLLFGNLGGLLRQSVGPAQEAIESGAVKIVGEPEMDADLYKELHEMNVSAGRIISAFPQGKSYEMELVSFKRDHPFYILTFAYKNGGNIVEVPGRGKMLFTVVESFGPSNEKDWFGKSKDQWIVTTFSYRLSLHDYRVWAKEHGGEFDQTKNVEILESIKNIGFDNYVQTLQNKQLESLPKQMRDQQDEFERSYDL